MKHLTFILIACICILLSSCGGSSGSSGSSGSKSSDADFEGVWFFYIDGEQNPAAYVIADDSGNVISASNFFNNGGSYHVHPNGDLDLRLEVTGQSGSQAIVITGDIKAGNFSVPAEGIDGTINKISDRGAAANLYSHGLSWYDGATETVAIDYTVDSSGVITSGIGGGDVVISSMSGYAFLDGNKFLMHSVNNVETNNAASWEHINLSGTVDAGVLEIDSSGTGNYQIITAPVIAPMGTN